MTTKKTPPSGFLSRLPLWLQNRRNLTIAAIIVVILIYLGYKKLSNKAAPVTYQTTAAETGTLVVSVSASGNITTGNNLAVKTTATGTVNQVYVKNGDTVTAGQKIADITPDQDSQQRQAQAWSSYLGAKNNLASAQAQQYSLQNNEFVANQKFINDAIANNLSTSDPTYIEENATWLAAEAAYKNQSGSIAQSSSNVNSSWLAYQLVSPTILAPAAGVVANLQIAPGTVIAPQTSSSSNSVTAQQLGTITKPNENPQATVDISEIDAPNVQPGQKVTMTLDAFPNKTFTGKVLVVNTTGQSSSGVTTYPSTIVFDAPDTSLYPNMAVTAQIITKVDNNVILVPSAGIETSNGTSAVRILKNGQVSTVTVTPGDSNDTQTAVTGNVNEGDNVITGTSGGTATATTGTTSIFGALGGGNRGFGGGGGGGAAVVRRTGGN